MEANRIEAAYWRHGAELRDLKRENARLFAALKPVVECRVTSAVTAEIAPGDPITARPSSRKPSSPTTRRQII